MVNRLGAEASPYLRSHADNPVDWWPWGPEAFAEARRRDVPVLVSIGYATCHWCHVMARESFADPGLAAHLNERFVAIKVDREERPEVDAVYLAAAGAFTRELGWPLNAFATPDGRPFFATTYAPPTPVAGHASFRQVLDAVFEAWSARREEVERNAAGLSGILAEHARRARPAGLPEDPEAAIGTAVAALAAAEDREHGGFGTATKFPVAPVLAFLAGRNDERALGLALRTLETIAASPLRDAVEGGFFRYATRRDWSEPHYERMLYDNAGLLEALAAAQTSGRAGPALRAAAEGIVAFLGGVLRLPGGALASAQDSESIVDGARSEGGYYRRDAAGRAGLGPPALDRKVLAGWNGYALGALARAGRAFGRPEWLEFSASVARSIEDSHVVEGAAPRLRRSVLDGDASDAPATLEDYGLLSRGLLDLAIASGRPAPAALARSLVDACLVAGSEPAPPGAADLVLSRAGLAGMPEDEGGTHPSGRVALADAALRLYELTGEGDYRDAAIRVVASVADSALSQPLAHGATLALLGALAGPVRQLVVVHPDDEPATRGPDAEGLDRAVAVFRHGIACAVTESEAREWAAAGFTLFADRATTGGRSTAYLCEEFVCRLPVTTADALG